MRALELVEALVCIFVYHRPCSGGVCFYPSSSDTVRGRYSVFYLHSCGILFSVYIKLSVHVQSISLLSKPGGHCLSLNKSAYR